MTGYNDYKYNPYFDFNVTNKLVEEAFESYEELFMELGVDAKLSGKMFTGTCPIHDGDNSSALNIYHDGYAVIGNWKCRTHHCESIWSKTFIGFIRGILSRDSILKVSWVDAVKWLEEFTGIKISDLDIDKPDTSQLERRGYNRVSNILNKRVNTSTNGIDRKRVRSGISIPSTYYLKRGYSKEILDKYDVGECTTHGKRMFNRVVVPTYDIKHQIMVGCNGRSLFEKCDRCKMHHDKNGRCLQKKDISGQKWLLSKGFNDKEHLYNYWYSKDFIRESQVAVLVESAGNVWRLEESGITNSISINGSGISEQQSIILESSGIMCLIVISDNDSAGESLRENIDNSYHRYFNIEHIRLKEFNDIGDMSVECVKDTIYKDIVSIMKDYS